MRRLRASRLLIGIIGIGVIVSCLAFTYGRRVQIYLSLGSAKPVSLQELRDLVYGPMGYNASLFQGAFYVGSDSSSDYVAIKHGRLAIYAFKTPRGDVTTGSRMEVTADEKKWVDLTGCFPVLSHNRTSAAAEMAMVASPKPHVRNCDFSQYHPLRMSSDWIWRGGILKRFEPSYPPEAKQQHLTGKISLRVLIKGNGEVVQACGDGPLVLRNAAERSSSPVGLPNA